MGMQLEKKCKKCQDTKPLTEFYSHTKKTGNVYYSPMCKKCHIDYCVKHHNLDPALHRKYAKTYKLRLRNEILDHYGKKCACCGETTIEFLAIDHINGGGNAHRRKIGRTNLYTWLKANNYPDGFQTLCHNCNMSKGFYGYCPHNHMTP